MPELRRPLVAGDDPGILSNHSPLAVVYGDREAIRSPETVYLEVPDKPPKKSLNHPIRR